MHERRSTIRLSCQGHVQQSSSDSSLPLNGRMRDLSEGGIGLLLDDAPHAGEHVTVHVPLAGQDAGLTATGVVRWSSARSARGQGCAVGVEWLPLDRATRLQLQAVLEGQAKHRPIGRNVPLVLACLGALLVGMLGYWLLSVHQESQQLRGAIRQREQRIAQLGREGQRLQQDLESATQQMAGALEQLNRLDQHTLRLEGQLEQMALEVGRAQQSSERLRQEREALMQRVLDLEQEREVLVRRLAAIPALPGASPGESEQPGNRGFLIQQGQPAPSSSAPQIRVHEPELSSP